MKPYFYFLLALASLKPFAIEAGERPFIIHFTRDQYSAANRNWVACQDEKGVMYFGNEAGLLESDGIGWKLHSLPHSPQIRGVAVASHQTIFTGGFEEMGRWDRDLSGTLRYTSLKGLVKEADFQKENILQVWMSDNKVYFQSSNHIYIYNYQNIHRITANASILFLLKVRGTYWIQDTSGQLFRLQGEKLQKVEGSDFLRHATVRVVLPYGTNHYLIGLSSGKIYRYDGKSFILWNQALSNELAGKELICGIYSPHQNAYFLGTRFEGLYKVSIQGTITDYFSTYHNFPNNSVLSLYEDRQYNIWTTSDRGISCLRYDNHLSYYLNDNHDAEVVYAATFWQDYLLLGTEQGVFYTLKSELDGQDLFSSLRLLDGTQGQVWSFTRSGDELYCAHNSGVIRISRDLKATRPYSISAGVHKIVDVRLKGKGLLLLATYNSPMILDKSNGNLYEIEHFDFPICNIETDYLNNIWLETGTKGVYKCRLGKNLNNFEHCVYYGYETNTALPAQLCINKIGERLIFLGDNRFFTYSESSDKLVPIQALNDCFKATGEIRKIVHSHDEEIWAVGSKSVHRFIYDGNTARILGSYAIAADNLSLVTDHENISILNDSTSLFCLDTGFILFRNSLHFPDSPQLPAPYIEAVEINNSMNGSLFPDLHREADIPYNFHLIKVKYSAGNAFAGNWQVECLLLNKDITNPQWEVPAKANEVTYDRLPKGKYLFKIRITDGMGNYSAESSFAFRMLPPWYLTPWAFACYASVILILFLGGWFLLMQRYRNLHLQQIRKKETKQLQHINEKLQNKLEEKDAELFTQTSFIVQKNELILKLKEMVNEWHAKDAHKSLMPLYLKMNQLLTESLDENEDWKMFLIKFEQKHHTFFKHLKAEHPALTHNDLRLCACLKLNLETKDIASLMNLSVRGVENNRYRLRKKLRLSPAQNLNEYFLKID